MKNILIFICFMMFINANLAYSKDIVLNGEKGAQIILMDNGDKPSQDYKFAKYKSPTGKEFLLERTNIEDYEYTWGGGEVSKNLRYVILDGMLVNEVSINDEKPKTVSTNRCPVVDFRSGCIVYMGTRYECAGQWKGNSIWVNEFPGKIDASKYKGPQAKAFWLKFTDDSIYYKKLKIKNPKFSESLDSTEPENIPNALVCDHINSENLAYYKLIKQQLKNEKNNDYKLIQKAIKEAAITSDKVSKQIVSKKAPLYNTPRNKDKSSAYLVAGDSVVIVDESKIKRGWYEISYISKSGKILNKWIHAADIAGNSNIKTLADEPEPKKKEPDFGGDKTLFSCRYAMIDSIDHKPIPFTKYKIKRADGSIEKGVTDKNGYTRHLKMGKEGKKEYIYLKLDI